MRRSIIVGPSTLLAVFLFTGSAFATPSWCPTARNPTEHAICGNPELGNLDDVLNTAYERANSDSPGERPGILAEQRRWLGRRNLCGHDAMCIERRYYEQIQFLESFYSN